MPEAMSHRDRILASIRAALGPKHSAGAIALEYAAIGRCYTQASQASPLALIDLFAERLREYDAAVYRSPSAALAEEIARILSSRGKQRIAIPAGIDNCWLPHGFRFESADKYDKHRLDAMDGLLSACTAAIAETGSIVLQNALGQGPRILSLVPDYHLCVVLAEQVVASVPEAFGRLNPSLPTTFISGPSATADIEMTRIRGVHGPRFLDVLIVTGSA